MPKSFITKNKTKHIRLKIKLGELEYKLKNTFFQKIKIKKIFHLSLKDIALINKTFKVKCK